MFGFGESGCVRMKTRQKRECEEKEVKMTKKISASLLRKDQFRFLATVQRERGRFSKWKGSAFIGHG